MLIKYFLFATVGLFIVIVLLFAALSFNSRFKTPNLGLVDQHIQACPQSPNCVCSEWPNRAAYIEAISFNNAPEAAWQQLKTNIKTLGGTINGESKNYLTATFSTPIFRFVDDLELRMDANAKKIQVRSASRVGHSDMGKNRKRVENLRKLFTLQGMERK